MKIKNEQYEAKDIKNRLHQHFKKCSQAEIQEGKHWYKEANKFASGLAQQYNQPLTVVVGVIAALSPQQAWDINKRNAVSFLKGDKYNIGATRQRIDKCETILGRSSAKTIGKIVLGVNGQKTHSFFLNILNPNANTRVTIDRHAIGLAIYSDYLVHGIAKLTKAQYKFIEDCYKHVAAKNNLLPHELQAILWVYWRNLGDLRAHGDVPF